MFASVEIAVGLGKKLAVPADAVIETGTRAVVYVDRGGGYFEPGKWPWVLGRKDSGRS